MQAEIKLTFESINELEDYIEQNKNGEHALAALNDFYNNVIRPIVKHGIGEYTEEQIDVFHEVAEKFWETLRENQVDL